MCDYTKCYLNTFCFSAQPYESIYQDGQSMYVPEHPTSNQVPRRSEQVGCTSIHECVLKGLPGVQVPALFRSI